MVSYIQRLLNIKEKNQKVSKLYILQIFFKNWKKLIVLNIALSLKKQFYI